jgi:sugar lactone lactonase YvrE
MRREILLLLACIPLFAQQYTISTIAGGGTAGVTLNNPGRVALDSAGNLYISDWSGFIRKLWAGDGRVTVVAGIGILGYGGDGGQATSAMIGKGISLALDAAGNIYIADSDNNRIRRVDALTGNITNVAGTGASMDSGDGGAAINAGVSRPNGITLDATGNLYFNSWSRVRKVTAATGIIETVAGQTSTSFSGDGGPATQALFWDPLASAVDPSGNLYIADYENSRIRKVEARTGIVTTIAGSGPCSTVNIIGQMSVCRGGFGGDGGPARAAQLNYPGAAALDALGNLYISDTINHRIRRVDAASGAIYTIAGVGVKGFSGDGGLALAAEIDLPAGIAVDSSGRVYFADLGNNRIRLLTPAEPQFYRFSMPRPKRPRF